MLFALEKWMEWLRGRGPRGNMIQWILFAVIFRETQNFPVSLRILKCKDEAVPTENFREWSLKPNAIKQLYKVVHKPKGLVTLCML